MPSVRAKAGLPWPVTGTYIAINVMNVRLAKRVPLPRVAATGSKCKNAPAIVPTSS